MAVKKYMKPEMHIAFWRWISFRPNPEGHLLLLFTSWLLSLVLFFDENGLIVQGCAIASCIVCLMLFFRFPERLALQHFVVGIVLGSLSLVSNGPPGQSISIKKDTFAQLEGVVEKIELTPNKKYRITIKEDLFSSANFEQPHALIRLSVRTDVPHLLKAGDRIKLSALLQPPGGALVPGGYDFGQSMYYQGIQLTGFSTSGVHVISAPRYGAVSFEQSIDNMRYRLADGIRRALPEKEGAVALALTLGIKSDIPDKVAQHMRDAGLSHLLAISGLHMGLIALICFFLFETLFAAIPAIALRIMPRKLAVFPVWIICFAYLLLSGSSTATLRAFIMITVGLIALLADRKVFTLRSVMIAAAIILFIAPQSLFSVGFQLSFAATTGLVLFYSRWPNLWQVEYDSTIRKLVRYAALIGVTSAVAQLSIAPFVLYHFQAISVISLATNIVVLPIVSFVLMPLLLFFMFSFAIGWQAFLASAVGVTLSLVLTIAETFASFPLAVIRLQQVSEPSFTFMILAFAAVLVGQYKLRTQLALLLISIGIAAYLLHSNVDVLISRSGNSVAIFRDGAVYSAGGRDFSFRAEAWRQYWGKDPSKKDKGLPIHMIAGDRRVQLAHNLHLTKAKTINNVRLACAANDIVLLPRRYVRYCLGAKAVVTLENLDKKGPLGIKQPFSSNPELIWSNEQS